MKKINQHELDKRPDFKLVKLKNNRLKQPRLASFLKRFVGQKRLALALLLLLVAIGFSWLRQQGFVAPEKVFAFLQDYPTLAPVLFIGLYILLSVTLVPTLPLNLGAGFLWGPLWGSLLATIGATIGATCAFLIARRLAGDYFNRKFNNSAWLWLRNETEQRGWRVVAFTRINPIFSFGPLNYFLGITSISLITYVWSTALFLMPPSLLFAAVGHSIKDFTLDGATHNLMRNILLISAAVTLLTVAKLTMKKHFRQE